MSDKKDFELNENELDNVSGGKGELVIKDGKLYLNSFDDNGNSSDFKNLDLVKMAQSTVGKDHEIRFKLY